jgi:uncharacterized membrane protein (DUF4010 family)
MNVQNIFMKFALALGVGILVGLQREYAQYQENRQLGAGIRTFALIGLVGCAGAMVADEFSSPWPYIAVLLISGIFFSINYFIEAWHGKGGLTTEFSALLTLLAGALVYKGHFSIAIATMVAITGLLSLKFEMHNFVRHLSKDDIFAILKFAIITAIVLPVLPNKNYGLEPFNIFNPYKIWLLVVLISGMSFVGYILIKTIGAKRGIGLLGFLGGLASSTAVTLTMTQRSKSTPELSRSFAQAILIAWTVMYARLLIIVTAINSALLSQLWLPVLGGVLAGLIYVLFLYYKDHTTSKNDDISFVNPFELGPAIKFGLLFSLILLISKAAQIYLGDAGVYLASIISGLADVDAIALSVAGMSNNEGQLSYDIAARAIIFAGLSNTVLKGVVAATSGSAALRKTILPGTVIMVLVVLLLLLF